MQQTCSQCGGLLAPGVQNCTYCGKPVASVYPQQNVPQQNPYGSYPQGNAGASNAYPPPYTQYATQGTYSTQAAPSSQPSVYNQSTYSTPPQPYGSAPQSAYGAPSQPYGSASQPAYGAPPQPFGAPSQPPLAMPPQPPFQKRRSSGALIGVVLAIIVVLAGLGVGGYFLFLKKGSTVVTTSTPTVPAPLYQASLTKDPGNWDCSDAKCSFRADGYHVQALDNYVYSAYLTKVFTDATIEVKAIMAQGVTTSGSNTSAMGISFHVPQSNKLSGYGFLIYADGTYDLVKWDNKGNSSHLVDLSGSSAIHQGLNQENDLKLVIKGTSFTLFINDQQLTQTTDSTYTGGYIGLNASSKGTEVIYSNLVITKP